MTSTQKIIKYLALALAALIILSMAYAALSIIGTVAYIFDDESNDAMDMKMTSYRDVVINKLDIDVSASELIIKNGDVLTVETNNKRVRVDQSFTTLSISEKNKFISLGSKEALSITVYIPADMMLDSTEIDTGAGRITIESLNTRELSLELGAGEAVIKNINVTDKATIDGGAGKVTVESGMIRDLEFDIGVGASVMSVELSGENDINCGVGSLNLELLGAKEDYTVSVDKGVGSVAVDGQSVSDGSTLGNGPTSVDIDGGVGEIIVKFK